MIENQDIEFKAVWKDKYLKWICGMANANGGIIYIGKDDKGNVIGINNAVKLVKEIPNKIKDTMGIIPEVKVEEENDLLYIAIKIDNYPMPISYQGKFYLRSGSNNHEVTGSELDKFMLDRVGKRWEDLPVKNATFDDLNEEPEGEMLIEEVVKTAERNRILHFCMEQLNPHYREALYLTYFENMSYFQAAEVMGKSEKQITNMVYRGKQSLRGLLEREGITNAE